MFVTDLPFRCEMEEQVLGKIDGDFTSRNCESYNSQVILMQMPPIRIIHVRGRNNNMKHWFGNWMQMNMQGIIMIMKALVCIPRKESNPDLWDVMFYHTTV